MSLHKYRFVDTGSNPLCDRVNVYLKAQRLITQVILLSVIKEQHPRIKREKKTIEAMVRYYCKKKHQTKGDLCPECTDFLAYAMMRLDKCPFQEKKSTCGKCLVHCYRPDMKEKVKKIMRYSGPRMLLHHPSLALHHVWDGRTKPPTLGKKSE